MDFFSNSKFSTKLFMQILEINTQNVFIKNLWENLQKQPKFIFKMAERRPSLILHINDHVSKTVYPFYMIFGIHICNSMAHNIKFSVFTKSKMAAVSACVIVIKNCHFESTGCISDDCNIEFVEILKINAYNKKKTENNYENKMAAIFFEKI